MRHRYHRTLSEQFARRIQPRLSRCSSRLCSVHALLQVVGTHNSYHQAPPEEIQNLAYNPLVDAVAGSYAQSAVNTTQYSHLNFYEQLELGKHLTWCLHLRARLPQQFIRQPFIICSMSDALSPYVMHAQDYATHCSSGHGFQKRKTPSGPFEH